jgi:hypothetical protein
MSPACSGGGSVGTDPCSGVACLMLWIFWQVRICIEEYVPSFNAEECNQPPLDVHLRTGWTLPDVEAFPESENNARSLRPAPNILPRLSLH